MLHRRVKYFCFFFFKLHFRFYIQISSHVQIAIYWNMLFEFPLKLKLPKKDEESCLKMKNILLFFMNRSCSCVTTTSRNSLSFFSLKFFLSEQCIFIFEKKIVFDRVQGFYSWFRRCSARCTHLNFSMSRVPSAMRFIFILDFEPNEK